MSCVGRIPFASLLATLITGGGVACACVCMHLGLPAFLAMLRLFKLTIREGVESAVMTAVISVGAVMTTLAVVLLIIGFLATGATRHQVYTGFRSRMSGRIASVFFIVLTYALTVAWFLFCCILILVTAFFLISIGNCQKYGVEGGQTWAPSTCFNVTTILEGIPGDNDLTQVASRLCGSEFASFCEKAEGSFHYFMSANVGVAAIVVGLLHFLTCLSANYAHIKDGMKLREYEEAKYAIDPSMYASYG